MGKDGRIALLAAGGTGGHLFPAESLAHGLGQRGWRVHLVTDERIGSYGASFPAEEVHHVPSATITRDPMVTAKAVLKLTGGFFQARRLIGHVKPAVAIGFGGYPTIPPMFAAITLLLPTVIHEANAVFGRANRFLASRVTRIATSFPKVGGAERFAARIVQTGNPVRPAVIEASSIPYPARGAADPFHLAVFGGSQGAQFLSDIVPAAVASLPKDMQSRLSIVQQCRPEDLGRVRQAYDLLGITADLQTFFADLPKRIAAANLVVSRSGASTCAELAVIGRPAIMVPLPHALDQDQKANAEVLAGAGGGWMILQPDLTPQRLGAEISRLMDDPSALEQAAAAAKSVGRPDAVDRLADLVEKVAA